MNTESTSSTNGQADHGTPIVLDDAGAQPAEGQQQAAPTQQEPAKPDPDELVLDLARRGRDLSRKEKEFQRTRSEYEAAKQEAMEYRGMRALAKTDPMAFFEKVADAAGLDLDTVVEAYTSRKTGAKLDPNDRVALLEKRIADKEAAEAKEREERDAKEKTAAGERALQQHLGEIRGFAASAAGNFPLFNEPDDLEANAIAAFDLRMLAHERGETLSNAAAVQAIEKQLRADAERRARRLGLSPSQGTPTPTPSHQTVPRAVNAAVAPIEASPHIKSDEDIAAEFAALFRRTG